MANEVKSQPFSLYNEENRDLKLETKALMSNLMCLKACTLLNYIKDFPKEADLKWSIFCAASNSYRFDSVLKPFPPFFLAGAEKKDIDRLREVIASCPSISELSKQLKENRASHTLLDLLYWVLIQLHEPKYKLIPKNEHIKILSQVPSVVAAAMPDYMFSVTYGSKRNRKFALMALNYSTKLAFHGSRLENFFSILNYGLQASFNKRGAFGPGTYLSSEMGISLSYSPVGFSWDSSSFGSHISIVALCEVIDHPEVKSEFDSKKCSRTNLFDICNNQSVPGKYFIVGNNDLVHVRYLLVYGNCTAESAALMTSPTLLGWIKRHKMFTIAAAYIILLLAIGSSSSSAIYKVYRRLMR